MRIKRWVLVSLRNSSALLSNFNFPRSRNHIQGFWRSVLDAASLPKSAALKFAALHVNERRSAASWGSAHSALDGYKNNQRHSSLSPVLILIHWPINSTPHSRCLKITVAALQRPAVVNRPHLQAPTSLAPVKMKRRLNQSTSMVFAVDTVVTSNFVLNATANIILARFAKTCRLHLHRAVSSATALLPAPVRASRASRDYLKFKSLDFKIFSFFSSWSFFLDVSSSGDFAANEAGTVFGLFQNSIFYSFNLIL